VCLSVNPSIAARQRLGKNFPAATMNCWRSRLLCCPCRVKGKSAISSDQKFLSFLFLVKRKLVPFDPLFISWLSVGSNVNMLFLNVRVNTNSFKNYVTNGGFRHSVCVEISCY
jgi:hypothetical protein